MSSVEQRLAEAGFELPAPPSVAGDYVPATRHGSLVITAGQLPLRAGSLITRPHPKKRLHGSEDLALLLHDGPRPVASRRQRNRAKRAHEATPVFTQRGHRHRLALENRLDLLRKLYLEYALAGVQLPKKENARFKQLEKQLGIKRFTPPGGKKRKKENRAAKRGRKQDGAGAEGVEWELRKRWAIFQTPCR